MYFRDVNTIMLYLFHAVAKIVIKKHMGRLSNVKIIMIDFEGAVLFAFRKLKELHVLPDIEIKTFFSHD